MPDGGFDWQICVSCGAHFSSADKGEIVCAGCHANTGRDARIARQIVEDCPVLDPPDGPPQLGHRMDREPGPDLLNIKATPGWWAWHRWLILARGLWRDWPTWKGEDHVNPPR